MRGFFFGALGYPQCENKFNIAASALRAHFALLFPESRGINYTR
jgi:hypothetical protein